MTNTTHTGNRGTQAMDAQGQARLKPSHARSSHTGKPMRAQLSPRVIAERVAELQRDDSVKRIMYRVAQKTRERVPYAFVKFQVAPISCRHRDNGNGPLCGCVWELATYNLHTGKLIAAKCSVGNHQRVLNASRVIAGFKRWYKRIGASRQDIARMASEVAAKLRGAQEVDA